MISDSTVGIIELVKNSYDADASVVTVTLDGLDSQEQTRLIIEDDGFGMSATDVIERFLSPAIDHKAKSKARLERTPRFRRIPIGEKGVGRFAIQKLGRRLELTTRASNQPEVVVLIDWDEFEHPDRLLSDVTFEVVEQEPRTFKGSETGTRIVLSVAREQWDQSIVEKLQIGLRRLRSPHIDAGKHDFDIRLRCSKFPQCQDLTQSDLRENFHYRFMALVDTNGKMSFEYKVKHPMLTEREVVSEIEVDLSSSVRDELEGRSPTCGPFYLNLYVWDRSPAYLKASRISKTELDLVSGVSLFRDKLRVFPYGEPGDDWLYLDKDRINNPSERIGNNQVHGYVEIDQQSSGSLRDKTNREGLIDNTAFHDLRALVRAAIRFFESHWRDDRPRTSSSIDKPEPPPVTKSLKRAQKLTTAIGQTASPDIRVTLVESNQNHLSQIEIPARNVSQREATKEALKEIELALSSQMVIESRQAEERELLLHLAATGQAAERIIHEVGRQSVAAIAAIAELREHGTPQAPLSILETAIGTLRNEFRMLSPAGGITRFQKRRQVSLHEALSTAIMLNQKLLDERNLIVSLNDEDFVVYARPSSVVQIFDNLIQNAAFWSTSEIRLCLDSCKRQICVKDDGPGVRVARKDAIFEPHFTTRPGGQGLGLYIVRELLNHDGGRISLEVTEGGALFLVDLSGYPTKSHKGEKE